MRIALTDRHYQVAQAIFEKTPVYRNSHRGEAANQVGILGEVVVRESLDEAGVAYDPEFTTTHDLRLPQIGRLEIKTKDRTVPPRPDYECSLPLYNHDHQNADYFAFVSLQRNRADVGEHWGRFHHAYLVGAANQTMIATHGKIWRAGETDVKNGTTFWTDCVNITIARLKPFDEAIAIWKSRQVDEL
jgi:hypothetical protein